MKKKVFLLLPLLLISSCSLKNNYDYINEEFDINSEIEESKSIQSKIDLIKNKIKYNEYLKEMLDEAKQR